MKIFDHPKVSGIAGWY